MATDIAFALGVLVLAARHAPAGLKPFILTLAIVDDIGAIIVIALLYAGGVSLGFLAAAAALCRLMLLLKRAGVRATSALVGLGALVWLATYESGVHPAIAGVVLGLLAPAECLPTPASGERRSETNRRSNKWSKSSAARRGCRPVAPAGVTFFARRSRRSRARSTRCFPWTSFVIMPLVRPRERRCPPRSWC